MGVHSCLEVLLWHPKFWSLEINRALNKVPPKKPQAPGGWGPAAGVGVTEAQRMTVTHQTLQIGEADQRNPMQPKPVALDLLDHGVNALSQGVAAPKLGDSTRGEAGGVGGGREGREREGEDGRRQEG